MAMSDKMGIIASSYGTIRFENEDYDSLLEKIKEIIDKETGTKYGCHKILLCGKN